LVKTALTQKVVVFILKINKEGALIFSPLPGEFIASAILRGNEILGIKKTKKNEFRIKKVPPSHLIYKVTNSIKFPELFSNNDIALQILYENTLYPLYAVLGQSNIYSKFTPLSDWKICLQCVIDDINCFGTAFIHVSHLPPSVNFCRKHATKLYTFCPSCSMPITNHEISKFYTCQERYHQIHSTLNHNESLYAKFIHELLDYREKPFYYVCIQRLIHSKLIENAFFYNSHFIHQAIRETIHNYFLNECEFKHTGVDTLDYQAAAAFFAYNTATSYLADIATLEALKDL
jgi:hypothetical protein